LITLIIKNLSKKIKIYSIIAVLFMFISGMLDIISIGIVIPIITLFIDPSVFSSNEIIATITDLLLIDSDEIDAFKLIIYFIIIVILSSLFKIVTLNFSLRLSRRIGAEISSKIFKNILMRPYKENLYSKSNEIVSTLTQRADSLTGLVYQFFSFMSVCLSLFMMLAFSLFINAKYTIVLIFLVLLIYITIGFFSKRVLKSKSKTLYLAVNERTKTMQSALNNLREIILNFSQDELSKIFSKSETSFRKTEANVAFLSMFPRYLLEGLAIIALSIFALILYKLQNNSSEILIILGTIVFATSKLLPIFSQIYTSWSNFYGYHKTLLDVTDLINIKHENKFVREIINSKRFNFNKYIEFKDVYYQYPYSKHQILKKLNFKIKLGEKVAIIGKTGSGKSTIISLLCGLLDDYKGSIHVDNLDIKKINFQEWIKNISHVPQEIFLSNDTIYDNIKFLNEENKEINKKEILRAADLATVTEFADQKENKINTVVGDNGKNLSGGQKQRVGLARGFLKKTKILILDEATNQLDKKTEEKIYNNIEKNFPNITLIVITHNHNLLDFFDKVINLDEDESTITNT
jgi:ATP-binding cassette, subfamily B, bacterial PglK